MPAKAKYAEIEARIGLPMAQILRELYDLHGNQAGVAKSLGVSQSTVSAWLIRFRLERRTQLVSERDVEKTSLLQSSQMVIEDET